MIARIRLVAATLATLAMPLAAQPEAGPAPMTSKGRFVMRDGAAIYGKVCAACHMADARGATGAGTYPALVADPRLKVAAYPLTVVLRGKGGMPEFASMLDDDQVAAVVGYIRTHFGNDYREPVTPAQVKPLRPAESVMRSGTAG